jgi:hypothetical protein
VTYRTKIRHVEAFQWTGQPRSEWPHWATPELLSESGSALYAYTKNAPVRVLRTDWLILGDKEIYPCTDEEFHKRYEEVPNAPAHGLGSKAWREADKDETEGGGP